MGTDEIIETLRKKFERISGVLDERGRRVWAAAEAEALGYGGQSLVAKATGLARTTLYREGVRQASDQPIPVGGRMRKVGGGRKKLTEQEPTLWSALEALVEPTTRGDPENPLRWTCLSTRQLAVALNQRGYRIGRQTVATLLEELGYSLQGNQKRRKGPVSRIGTPNSDTFTAGLRSSNAEGNPSSQWTRRKRNSSGISRMGAANGDRRAIPNPFEFMILWIRRWEKSIRTGCTIRPPTWGGSAWGWTTIPPSLPWRRYGGGGRKWVVYVIRLLRNCW